MRHAISLLLVSFLAFSFTARGEVNNDYQADDITMENTNLDNINHDQFLFKGVKDFFKKGFDKIKGLFSGKGEPTEKACDAVTAAHPDRKSFTDAAQGGGMTDEQLNQGLICYE